MTDAAGNRRKLIIFTEPRDTLTYLADKIRTLLGRAEAVVEIHGGLAREARRNAMSAFLHDPAVLVLVANDAAGEGVNLQRAHLMVNYDLPWNPNRIEQRFGRIHRIGQTEVCHLWNLVAARDPRGRGLRPPAGEARGGARGARRPGLRRPRPAVRAAGAADLLIEAIRYGEQPEVKARLLQVVDDAAGHAHLLDLLDRRALTQETLPFSRVQEIREQMERAHAQRLQPHYIESFFREAFEHLGGRIHRREAGRFEITRVPGRSARARPPDRHRRAGARRATSASASTRRRSPGRRSPPSSAPATRCSTPPSTLLKGRSGGASTKHLYRSGSSSTGDHILWLSSGTTPNLRHEASGGGSVSITSSVAIGNDRTWSTIVGTWRPGRLS